MLMAKIKVSSPVQDRRKDHESLDQAAQADAREGIRQGLEEARKGLGQPARKFALTSFLAKPSAKGQASAPKRKAVA
jgi:hypothetical protein